MIQNSIGDNGVLHLVGQTSWYRVYFKFSFSEQCRCHTKCVPLVAFYDTHGLNGGGDTLYS